MLELSLLGSPCAALDGIPLHGTLLHKDLALLYYLAVSGQPQPRARLAALLWSEIGEESARRNLRKSLTELRRHLSGHLTITRDEIGLEPAQCTLDVWRLERFATNGVAAADPVQLQEAATLNGVISWRAFACTMRQTTSTGSTICKSGCAAQQSSYWPRWRHSKRMPANWRRRLPPSVVSSSWSHGVRSHTAT